ncbi:MAG: D-sedoheptulose 7-phosphate isomerase [Candidatus Omnitrophica bacterium]|nr:D-sedoheptulose 7-phosphate isomerase [Candidatus Omnitrophota bacterium]MBU1932751.1 D-sedoheptulose 7-phosphate isomerase [Candidatus Omnitrophota bacterium]
MKNKIEASIKEDIQVKEELLKNQASNIYKLARMMLETVKKGNKILIFGNGGSAADSLHIAAELVGRFKKERRSLPAIALSSNVAILTALANDYSFERIFERQVEALGEKGDMALGISTSGKSENVFRGILKASKIKMKTAVLTGKYKGRLSRIADLSVCVPSDNTPRVQESHITIGHIVCELIENGL